ncbi:Cupin 1 [Corchorus olitorius]|uniref:Cupin 1 n=1 Tax=Corchorus olitorius TaxID=93759 RepID=A0A1R3JNU4_9ROSI|nr:Cupin 1 [Corchorus olitorius]
MTSLDLIDGIVIVINTIWKIKMEERWEKKRRDLEDHYMFHYLFILSSIFSPLSLINPDLSPRLAKKLYGDHGGSYHAWCPNELAMLREENIGAAKLALENDGFALPRYSDSAKVAYVLQGTGVAGIVLPESEEKVIAIKKGDAIALPFGVITWWYNKEDTKLVVLFLGDTSKGHKAGQFTDFFLTGTNGIFNGFTTEFVKRAWDVDDETVKALVGNQTGNDIVKLDANVKMPEPKSEHRVGMALNREEAPLDTDIKDAGNVVVLNTKNLPLVGQVGLGVGQVGLGADLVRLEGNAMCSPGFSCDSALQVTYIVKGSGRLQVVGVDGERVLETIVKADNLLIVPRFFVVSKIADPDGLSWFSIITTPNPVFTHLAGSIGAWKSLSTEVLQASFNVNPETEKLFRSKRTNDAIFFPPPK